MLGSPALLYANLFVQHVRNKISPTGVWSSGWKLECHKAEVWVGWTIQSFLMLWGWLSYGIMLFWCRLDLYYASVWFTDNCSEFVCANGLNSTNDIF